MIWLKNFAVYLLSSLLFLVLVLTVFATNINVIFAKPAKIETWFDQSGMYDGLVNAAIKKAKTSNSDNGSGGISLSDVAVQQAAKSAFSTQTIKTDVNKFIYGNYTWLEGKVAKPSFVIDLSGSKQLFAQQVGQYVTANLARVPVCTYAQSLNYLNSDPLTTTCRPSNVSAGSEGAKITEKLSGPTFISNTMISAETFGNSSTTGKNKPYYNKFSQAPKIYQWATKAPMILGLLAFVSALGIVFMSRSRREGLRRVATTLAFVGIIFIVGKFVVEALSKTLEKTLFKNSASDVSSVKVQLTALINLFESEITKVFLYFGITFIIIAALIIFGKIVFKDKSGRIKALRDKLSVGDDKPSVSSTQTTASPASNDAKPVKKPRLIQ